MSRSWCRVKPADEQILVPLRCACPECGRVMRMRYSNHRAIVSLRGLVRVRLKIRRCESRSCGRYHQAWRPEGEAALALPQHEFGLDVITLTGTLRYREHRSVPEIHQELTRRGVAICERSVTNLLERYDELVAASAGTAAHREALERQGRVILAIFSLMLAIRSCGSSAIACRGWSCWPGRCCRRPVTNWPACCVRSRRIWLPSGSRSTAWSATASIRSGSPSPRSGPMSHINCAIFITCGRQPCRSLRPTGMPRKS